MEDIEVPTESVQEEIHHQAEHAKERWINQVALSSALLAGLAAVAAMLSGHHSNEAMIERIRSSDHWSHYQAKGIKGMIASLRLDIKGSRASKEALEQEGKSAERYEEEKKEVEHLARESEAESERHLRLHQIFARAVTFFQVAIAIAAISVLTRRRRFWLAGLGFGALGLVFFIQGFF